MEKINNGEFIFLENNKLKVVFCDVGASIVSIIVKEKNLDVVLGYKNPEDYYQYGTYFGAVCGLCANRISKGKFSIKGKVYSLDINNGPNHLHGGEHGISIKRWDYQMCENQVVFTLKTLEKETGYPGDSDLKVVYKLDNNKLIVDYYGTSSEDTIFNLTNHSYFNLNGHDSGNVLKHQLKLNASQFVPIDKNAIPLGYYQDVTNTPFDFTKFKEIGRDINKDDLQIKHGTGYDHSFCVDKHVGTLVGDLSGIVLDVYTTCVGTQVYTGNWIFDVPGKDCIYQKYSGVALETQFHPDAINQKNFDKPIVKKGNVYHQQSIFEFSCK